jgi:hypothetical protein
MDEQMKIEFPAGRSSGIAVVKNAIPENVCSELVDKCLENYDTLFSPGPTLGGINLKVKNTMDFSFSKDVVDSFGIDSSVFSKCEDAISMGLYSALAMYVQEYKELHHVDLYDTGYRLQRYFPRSGFYRSHTDGDPWSPAPINLRVLGIVMYLNTVSVGGGTGFPEHDVVIPASVGDISIFPAYWTHPHVGRVPISGDKWMISTFIVCNEPEPKPIKYECKPSLIV